MDELRRRTLSVYEEFRCSFLKKKRKGERKKKMFAFALPRLDTETDSQLRLGPTILWVHWTCPLDPTNDQTKTYIERLMSYDQRRKNKLLSLSIRSINEGKWKKKGFWIDFSTNPHVLCWPFVEEKLSVRSRAWGPDDLVRTHADGWLMPISLFLGCFVATETTMDNRSLSPSRPIDRPIADQSPSGLLSFPRLFHNPYFLPASWVADTAYGASHGRIATAGLRWWCWCPLIS